MFANLMPLLKSVDSVKLTLKVTNGLISVVVIPQPKSNGDSALSQPLTLTGTAAELDEGFAEALSSFQSSRLSLEEQTAATAAILKEATKKSSEKAVKALTPTAAGKSGVDTSEGTDEDEDNAESSSQPQSNDNVAAAPGATDLASLI